MRRGRGKISKAQVADWLKRRFLLRLHMFWILSGTFLSGVLATNALVTLDVNILWVRYAVAVCAAYIVFLVLIRLWLWYVGTRAQVSPDTDGADMMVDFFSHLRIDGGAVPDVGGGGAFGGGGATGSWGDADVQSLAGSPSQSSVDLPGCFDVDDGFAVVLLVALVLAVLVAGIYIIWVAPAILAEVAFEAALAAALAKRARKIDRPGWVGAVWRATVWPFAGVLLVAGALGAYAQYHCPDAKQLSEALNCAKPRLISSDAP